MTALAFDEDFNNDVLTRKSHQWGDRGIPDGPRVRFPGQ